MNRFLLYLSIFLAIAVGSGLRVYQLGTIPWALNRDEASIGYNAYSILDTGRDEHGVSWPINVESFGDWKLPVYMYFSMPLIATFGLQAWVVRLPSALAGIALIPAAFYFVLAFKTSKKGYRLEYIGVVSSWLIAISPWSLRLSRVAYEANVALLLAVVGISLIIRTLYKKQTSLLLLGLLLSFSTVLTYHAYQVFTPLLLITLVVYFRTEVIDFIKKQKLALMGTMVLLFLFAFLLISGNTSKANGTKFSGLSIFSEETYHTRLFNKRMSFPDQTSIAAKIYANSGTMVAENIARNVASLTSLDFLFINGGTHGSHDIAGIGNLYWITGFFVVTALVLCIQRTHILQRERTIITILVCWLGAAAIAPLITIEPAHSIRFSSALFAFEVLAAVGIVTSISLLKNRYYQISIALVVILLYLFAIVQTIGTYFVIYPQRDLKNWRWYNQQLSLDLLQLKNRYKKIYMPQVDSSPYIFLLFDWSYTPSSLSENITYYPTDSGGFTHASRLENIYFEPVNWSDFVTSPDPILVFIESREFDKQNISAKDFTVIKKYEANNDTSIYYLISNE